MIPVSEKYKELINGANNRLVLMEASLSSADPNLIQQTKYDAENSSEQSEQVSRPAQLYNQISRMLYGWNTLEPQRVDTSGNFVIFDYDTVGEFGWWGNDLSGEYGTFSIAQKIVLKYDNFVNVQAFSIFWDYWAQEWATQFEIKFLNQDGTTLKIVSVIEFLPKDASTEYRLDEDIYNIWGIELTIYKWSKPYRRAKITEILAGQEFRFDANKIVSFERISNLNLMNDSLIASEMSIDIENYDKVFDPVNPSGIAQYLIKKQLMQASFIVGSEIIAAGLMYLYLWTSENGIANFRCRSLEAFSEINYFPISSDIIMAYDLFVEMFDALGVTDYLIDDRLKTIRVNRYAPEMTLRDALAKLAAAAGAVVYNKPNGLWTVGMISDVLKYSGNDITFDNMPELPRIVQEDIVNSVNVTAYTYSYPDVAVETLVDAATIDVYGTNTIVVPYGKIARGVEISVLNGEVQNTEIFADRARLLVYAPESVIVTITGVPVTQNVSRITINNTLYTNDLITNDVTIDNPFIDTIQKATEYGERYLDISNHRLEITANHRGRPDIEVGDFITIQNEYGYSNAYMFEQVIEWNLNDDDGILREKSILHSKRVHNGV